MDIDNRSNNTKVLYLDVVRGFFPLLCGISVFSKSFIMNMFISIIFKYVFFSFSVLFFKKILEKKFKLPYS